MMSTMDPGKGTFVFFQRGRLLLNMALQKKISNMAKREESVVLP